MKLIKFEDHSIYTKREMMTTVTIMLMPMIIIITIKGEVSFFRYDLVFNEKSHPFLVRCRIKYHVIQIDAREYVPSSM